MSKQHAQPAGEPVAAEVGGQFLTFKLGERTFAIGIDAVKEIIRFGTVTAVPRTPDWIRGIVNLRGAVLPVLDLNVYVGQLPVAVDGQTCIVVIKAEGSSGPIDIGLMVDSVAAVLTVATDQVEPVPPFGVGLRPQLLLGMLREQERFILLLDAVRAFSSAELVQRGWAGLRVAAVPAALAA